ncbi:MAG: hemolysin family protein [Kiritimatiellae bacterium]|nr:hemolysin family protein [Kiritimatiellia bacterium]
MSTPAATTDPESLELGWHLFILLLAILANAFFAASEIAIISLNDAKVRRDADQGDRMSRVLRKFIDEPGRFLATIQVGVTLAGFLASAFAAVTFAEPLARWFASRTWCPLTLNTVEGIATIAVTIMLAFLTLILGELVPKRIAMQYSEPLSRFVARPLSFIASATAPFVTLLNFVTNRILLLFGVNPTQGQERVSEEEIRMMVDIGGENGSIEPQEKEMIENVFEFNNKTAGEIMVHRLDIAALPIDVDEAEIRQTIRKSSFSRIPVYSGTIDNIMGILNTRDYLIRALEDRHPKLADLLRKPFFVPETIRADILFRQMQKSKQAIAIVLDEFGGTCGLVSVEDLLEEIVGEIYDEYDVNVLPPSIVKLSETDFRLAGETEIDDAAEALGVEIPEGDFNTLGGFILEKLGSIPSAGAHLAIPELHLEMTVETMDGNRIDSVLVHKTEPIKPPQADAEEDD